MLELDAEGGSCDGLTAAFGADRWDVAVELLSLVDKL